MEENKPPMEPPWLVSFDSGEKDEDGHQLCRLHTLLDQEKRVVLRLPKLKVREKPRRWSRCAGSSGPWLVMLDDECNPHLVNPLTSSHVRLPPITSLPGVEPRRDRAGRLVGYHLTPVFFNYTWEYRWEQARYWDREEIITCFFRRFAVAWRSRDDCVVVSICFPFRQLVFARAGDRSWTPLSSCVVGYEDVVLHGGLFHALHHGGWVEAYDLRGSFPVRVTTVAAVPPFRECEDKIKYLVSSSGDLLFVARTLSDARSGGRTEWFRVYRLEQSDGGAKGNPWVRLQETLEERAVLFVGESQSLSISAPDCFPPTALRGGCIYFTDDSTNGLALQGCSPRRMDERDQGVFCVRGRRFLEVLPQYPHVTPLPPLWFQPSMC